MLTYWRLSDYLKNVKHTVDELDWRTALSDCLGCPHPTPGWGGSLQLGSDYFTFADKLEATLRGIGRRQVREAEEQAAMINSLLIDPGWHHCLLDKKNESETDSWSVRHGRGVGSRRRLLGALWRACVLKSLVCMRVCVLAFVAASGSLIYIYRVYLHL